MNYFAKNEVNEITEKQYIACIQSITMNKYGVQSTCMSVYESIHREATSNLVLSAFNRPRIQSHRGESQRGNLQDANMPPVSSGEKAK